MNVMARIFNPVFTFPFLLVWYGMVWYASVNKINIQEGEVALQLGPDLRLERILRNIYPGKLSIKQAGGHVHIFDN